MGKAKKLKVSSGKTHLSLEKQIEEDALAKPSTRVKNRIRKEAEEEFVDSRLSEKILRQARKQQEELEDDVGTSKKKLLLQTKLDVLSDESEEEENADMQEVYYEKIEVDEEDERALEMFMSNNPAPRRTLADIIMEKITEKKTELQTEFSDAGSIQIQDLDPRVKQLYEGVKEVLAKYRSGKIPKAFKIVPNLRNWEQILYVTVDPIRAAYIRG